MGLASLGRACSLAKGAGNQSQSPRMMGMTAAGVGWAVDGDVDTAIMDGRADEGAVALGLAHEPKSRMR